MKNNKKIKIHVKNNHWASGSFPTDAEGEKNFTIRKSHFDEALYKFPEMKEKLESMLKIIIGLQDHFLLMQKVKKSSQ